MALLTGSRGDFVRSLGTAQPYKPGQGAKARNATLVVALFLIAAGVHAWSRIHDDLTSKWIIPLIVAAPLAWVAYRLVHYPRFADFLITTEAEMNKVSWPAWTEVKVSTVVVLVSVVCMSAFLFVTDQFWIILLQLAGILRITGLMGGGGGNM